MSDKSKYLSDKLSGIQKTRLYENLRMIPHAPGVQMAPIPEDGVHEESDDEEENAKSSDQRISIRASDKRIVNEAEYSDSEDDGEGRRDEKSYKTPRKKIKPGSPITSMIIDSTKATEKEVSNQPTNENDNGSSSDNSLSEIPGKNAGDLAVSITPNGEGLVSIINNQSKPDIEAMEVDQSVENSLSDLAKHDVKTSVSEISSNSQPSFEEAST